MLLGVLIVAGCSSSDEEKTEFVFNPNALSFTKFTTNPASDTFPAWNPSGTRLAFISTRTNSAAPCRIWSMTSQYVRKPSFWDMDCVPWG